MASRCEECKAIFADRENTGTCAPCQLTLARSQPKRTPHLRLVPTNEPRPELPGIARTSETEKQARHAALAEARRILQKPPETLKPTLTHPEFTLTREAK
jgi:hypothetical protein